jgi:hypothetical protein
VRKSREKRLRKLGIATRTSFGGAIDGKVRVFKQWSSPFYNANFYHNRMKVQTSLKTADPDEAKQKAFNWFIEPLTTLKAGGSLATSR